MTKSQKEMLKNGVILPANTESVLSQYKEPLKPVESGYGYLGTIAFNKEQTHTQCHICGYFFKRLGVHITNQHSMKVVEYRDKFQLARQSSLVATETRQAFVERYTSMTADEKLKRITSMGIAAAASRENKNWKSGYKKSLEAKNKEGRCPDQLLEKIELQAKELGYTPSSREFASKYGSGYLQSVKATYGGWNNAVKILGLKPREFTNLHYDERKLKVLLWDFKEQHGREPFMSDLKTHTFGASSGPFYRVFGSFAKAKEIAYAER